MLIELLNRRRPKIPTLWYENKKGVRWIPSQNELPEPPDGYHYQWSQFPGYVQENCLRGVLQSEVDECDHDPEYIKRTGGWINGVKGRECMVCNGTQVCEEKDYPDGKWPEKWEAQGSRELMRGESGYPTDLVMAMLRPSFVELARQIYRFGLPAIPFTDFTQAVLYSKTACERCVNSLAYRHGLNWGYRRKSDKWHKAGTSCELCDPEFYKTMREKRSECSA